MAMLVVFAGPDVGLTLVIVGVDPPPPPPPPPPPAVTERVTVTGAEVPMAPLVAAKSMLRLVVTLEEVLKVTDRSAA